jgi:hypothetical protein
MFNKLISIGVALAIMGSAAGAAQIGDTVQAVVPLENRVTIPGSVLQDLPTEVTHITLESGVWSISAQVNMLAFQAPNQAVFFVGANINPDSVAFENAPLAEVVLERLFGGNTVRPLTMVPRIFDVEDGTDVFLVAGNFNPAMNISAWGFITALKVRNHVNP